MTVTLKRLQPGDDLDFAVVDPDVFDDGRVVGQCAADNVEANGLYLKLGGQPEPMHYYEFKLLLD